VLLSTYPLRTIFIALSCLTVVAIISLGFVENSYLTPYPELPSQEYPIGFVVTLLVLMSLQTAVITGLELNMTSRWKYGVMLFFMLISFTFSGILSMHAPPPIGPYLWWQLIVIICLIGLSLYHSILYFRKV
jgi:hypothetical protein